MDDYYRQQAASVFRVRFPEVLIFMCIFKIMLYSVYDRRIADLHWVGVK